MGIMNSYRRQQKEKEMHMHIHPHGERLTQGDASSVGRGKIKAVVTGLGENDD